MSEHDVEKEFTEIDLAQISFNLSLSYEERLAYHQSALDLIFELSHSRQTPKE
jgi:hypothetical protein